jgi:hypothetical protein
MVLRRAVTKNTLILMERIEKGETVVNQPRSRLKEMYLDSLEQMPNGRYHQDQPRLVGRFVSIVA